MMLSIILDGVELMIIIIATFAQALSGRAPAVGIIGALVVWRFIVSEILAQDGRITDLTSDGRRYRW